MALSRENRAVEMMRRCDIFVDQLVLGAHCVAALEAMACGKPVICYIKEEGDGVGD